MKKYYFKRAAFLFTMFLTAVLFGQQLDKVLYSSLKYRFIGPVGNRIIAVTGVPGDSRIFYAGSASGGLFKTNDTGIHWSPVTDSLDVSSVSAVTVAPSDYNVVWIGTGETFIRSNISIGNGVYRSTDGGKTWEHIGLENTGRIARIVVHPKNPDIVYAAAMGTCYGPQPERGVFRTKDGGRTWQKILFIDENTGCSDIAIDPKNPRILIAGMWQILMRPWQRISGGPGSGLWMSRDGGDTWKKLEGKGLPKPPLGKIGVAFAPSNPDKIYALIETAQYDFKGVLWRSDNGGKSWKLISYDQNYTQRPHYYTRCVVSPVDEDEVYFLAHGVWKSIDGGKNAKKLPEIGGDDHDMWINPENPDIMIVGNDGTAGISVNRGKTWHRPALPDAQMYHVELDNRIPYNVYGNRQDGPSTMGPSNSRSGKVIPSGLWHSVGGFECGFAKVDPEDNNIVWAGGYDGLLTRYNLSTGHARNVTVWPDEPMGWPPGPLKFRWNWTFPIFISPHNHNKIYVGSQYVHCTTDGGNTWNIISPDLTTNDKSRLRTSGGLTIDNVGVDFGCTLFAIAESPVKQGVIWTGSNDGQVNVTTDGGQTWENVSKNIPKMPEWGIISNIEPSHFDAGVCYITVDAHRMNNRNPYVYKTENYGKSWKLISKSIPKSMLSYAHCVKEDSERPEMLYLGTENCLYFSLNDGKVWYPLRNNMPPAPVHWLEIQKHFSDLVVATYGRGFWILDDITPLRRLDKDILESDAYLFSPRAAYRFQEIHSYVSVFTNADGKNPPYGASLNYWLKKDVKDTVYIEIVDSNNKVIRTIKKMPKKKGINRVWWDLRHDKAAEPKLRNEPLGHPGEGYGPERLRYGTKGYRPLITWGQGGHIGPKVVPGIYSVRLYVGNKHFERKVEIKKDPNTEGSIQDIEKQVNLSLAIRDDISRITTMINSLEWIRKQIDDLVEIFSVDTSYKVLIKDAEELDKKCVDVEKEFFQLTLTGTGADDLRGPTMLLSKLMNLNRGVQTGDFAPTSQQIEVFKMHHKRLDSLEKTFKEVMENHVKIFNKKAGEKGAFAIIRVTEK